VPVAEEIVGITDAVCLAVLDEEYADLARRAAAKLARKRPSPLVGGRRVTWAAAIVYALGQANFLFDPVAEQNPLVWIIAVNGVAMDTRHVPMDIQVEAHQRGLIPYVPALGPDGEAAAEESPVAGKASATAPALVGLLERSSELKRQLVDFACSRRFFRELDKAVSDGIGGTAIEESDTNLLDHFILQRPLADGRTVVEVFVAEHPERQVADRVGHRA